MLVGEEIKEALNSNIQKRSLKSNTSRVAITTIGKKLQA